MDAPGLTVIDTTAIALPPLLVAVTVYLVRDVTAVGIPLITPVAVLKLRPAGSAGLTLYEVTVPPMLVGSFSVIGAFTM
jgi:hypothetical protein